PDARETVDVELPVDGTPAEIEETARVHLAPAAVARQHRPSLLVAEDGQHLLLVEYHITLGLDNDGRKGLHDDLPCSCAWNLREIRKQSRTSDKTPVQMRTKNTGKKNGPATNAPKITQSTCIGTATTPMNAVMTIDVTIPGKVRTTFQYS
ncbi:MAG: hypothetical protein V1778_02440, partial [bacterium]